MKHKYIALILIIATLISSPTVVYGCVLSPTREYSNYIISNLVLYLTTIFISWLCVLLIVRKKQSMPRFFWRYLLLSLGMLVVFLGLSVGSSIFFLLRELSGYNNEIDLFGFSLLLIIPFLVFNYIVFWLLRRMGILLKINLTIPTIFATLIPFNVALIVLLIRVLLLPFTGNVYVFCPPYPF